MVSTFTFTRHLESLAEMILALCIVKLRDLQKNQLFHSRHCRCIAFYISLANVERTPYVLVCCVAFARWAFWF